MIKLILSLLLSASAAIAGQGMYPVPMAYQGGGGGGDTISFIASSSCNNGGSGDLTCNVPTGTTDGDLMVAMVTSDTASEGINNYPDGSWVEVGNTTGSSHGGISAYKIAASEGSTLLFDMQNNSAPHSGVVMTFRKTGGTWDIDQDYGEAVVDAQTSVTLPSVTATDNSVLVTGWFNDNTQTGGVTGAPSGLTMAPLTDGNYSVGIVSASVIGYYQLYATGATVTGKSITWASSDDCSVIGLIIDLVP